MVLYFMMMRETSRDARKRLEVMRARSWVLSGEVRNLDGWRILSMQEKINEKRAGRRSGNEKKAMKAQR